jgi:hypothetical protein
MRELHNKPKDSSIIMHIHDARISSRLAYGHPDRTEGHVANARKFSIRLDLLVLPQTWRLFLHISLSDLYRERNVCEVGTRQEVYRKTYVGVSLEAKAISENKDRLFKDQEEAKCVVGILCTVDVFTIADPATLFVMAMILHPEWQT